MTMEVVSWNGLKVFCATTFNDRHAISDKITDWIRANPQKQIVDKQVLQSSDSDYHCLTIVLFFNDTTARPVSAEALEAALGKKK